MVTGAGGSIGSEICRQAARFCPSRLVLVDQAEGLLFETDRELRERWVGLDLQPVVADITDKARIDKAIAEHKPQVIFHCAAHKHVTMMELNPGEAIKNNVVGTAVLAESAASHGVATFVMVSTDKAVNPTSMMGASKRCAELYVQALNELGVTRFVAVRFGNVLGSSGSVVPIFARQIAAGGPVTVTHPEMRRYFMTIPEASQLVMQAGAIGAGGEIFVLDMGEPVRIVDLAREMIRRSGLREGRDIFVEFSGMRPGEKLFEELSTQNEAVRPTSHEKIRVWQLPQISVSDARRMVKDLASVADRDRAEVIEAVRQVVPEYQPAAGEAKKPAGMRLVA